MTELSQDTATSYPRDPKIDKQQRIVDPFNGRPLRDRRSRGYGRAPFKGQAGSAHPRAKRLAARIQAWEETRTKQGRKRPGSLSK